MSFFSPASTLPTTKKLPANINHDNLSTNQEAIQVPYLAGVQKISLIWVTPVYNATIKAVSSSTGKGSTSVTGYKYGGDLAGLVCLGPLDVIYMVLFDSDIVWPPVSATPDGSPVQFQTAGFFRAGGHDVDSITIKRCDSCRIYWGTETQQPSLDAVLKPRGTPPGGPTFNPRDPSTWPNSPALGGEQTFDSEVAGDVSPKKGHYDKHPDYLGQCVMVFQGMHFGQGRNSAPSVSVIVGRATSWFSGGSTTLDLAGVTPAGPIFEALTNQRYGGEFSEAQLDATSFGVLATALADFPLSPLVTTVTSLRAFLSSMNGYYDGWLRQISAIISAGLFTHGNVDTSGLPHVTNDDLTKEPDLKSAGFEGTFNYFSVVYPNRHRFFKDDVARETNIANRNAVGETRPTSQRMPWIIDDQLAEQFVSQYAFIGSQTVIAGTMEIKRERLDALGIAIGGRFFYDSPNFSRSFVMRCQDVEYPADKDGTVKLGVESERGLWPAAYLTAPPIKNPDFIYKPDDVTHARILELPIGLRTDVAPQIAILAKRPNVQIIGFNAHASVDGTTYSQVAPQMHFAAFGVLGVNYAIGANPDISVGMFVDLYGVDLDSVVSQSDQQRDDANLLLFIDNEIMSVGAVVAVGAGRYQILGERGLYNSVIAAHTAGAQVWFMLRSLLYPISNANFIAGNLLHFKFQPYTELELFDISGATVYDYTFTTPVTLAAPGISPGSQSFDTSIDITLGTLPTGAVARYAFDSDVSALSTEWPKSGGVYTTLHVVTGGTIQVQYFMPDGSSSPVTFATYTLVGPGAGGTPTCGAVSFSFSGTQNLTAGTLTLLCATGGATMHYSKNGAAYVAYTVPFAVAKNDIIDAYASHASFNDSSPTTFDNTYYKPQPGGGGHGGVIP